jgi:hypothetical protein
MLSIMVMVILMLEVAVMVIHMEGGDIRILIPMVVLVTTIYTVMNQVISQAVTLKS